MYLKDIYHVWIEHASVIVLFNYKVAGDATETTMSGLHLNAASRCLSSSPCESNSSSFISLAPLSELFILNVIQM